MSKAVIEPGACGFTTHVEVSQNDEHQFQVKIESACPHIQKMAAAIDVVNPYQEISFRKDGPSMLKLGAQHCAHPACPVPVGIIKAIEVEAGLNVARDVLIHLEK